MYFAGINTSKFMHDCAIIDKLGDVITASQSFNNDRESFLQFAQLLEALGGEKEMGFESRICGAAYERQCQSGAL